MRRSLFAESAHLIGKAAGCRDDLVGVSLFMNSRSESE
jgi:hypothetical protein